jgi:membrane-associated phospholipid phosphatase
MSLALPSHPSYPSGHSCISGASAAILAAFFPAAAEQLRAEAVEAGRSRVYAGIHYQFDCDVGRALGETVAGFAMAVETGSALQPPSFADRGARVR